MQKYKTFYSRLLFWGVSLGRLVAWSIRLLWSLKPRYVVFSVLSASVVAGAFLFFSGRIHNIFADGEITE
ncbi:MAG: hypothetical protein WBC29_04465, partial [Candidatus Moraniibacteriota bacterium]